MRLRLNHYMNTVKRVRLGALLLLVLGVGFSRRRGGGSGGGECHERCSSSSAESDTRDVRWRGTLGTHIKNTPLLATQSANAGVGGGHSTTSIVAILRM